MNQREIKFRVWFPLSKIMEADLEEDGIDLFTHSGEGALGVSCHFKDEDDLKSKHWQEDGILLQYTGLKDKNGKEIYEGDIVRWDDGSNGAKWRVAVVEINPDIQFRIVRINSDIEQSAKEGHIFHFGRFIYTDTENHLEVVGNIFEHPHLLETSPSNPTEA